MANSSVNLTSLDFDTLKESLKTYLQTQSVFKDYNFDGSNINVLLDIMSHNSYLNSFYLNMVASEMFLDSAQKLDSVISHAKELNYLPRSARSSAATINLNLTTIGTSSPLTLPKGTSFTGTNSNGTFTFSTDQLYAYTSPNTTYNITDLTIYDGFYVTDSYIMDRTSETQKFVLSNANADLNSLSLTVFENNGADATLFTRKDTLFGLNEESAVFFVQASESGKYEIIFGDGLFGRVPLNGALITAEYRVCSGEAADGITSFICNEDIGDINNGEVTVDSIVVTANSTSGAVAETIESIRFAAPRYFATQQRAVASDDYASLVLTNFGGEISDVSVYGGELLEPKQYGRVVLALKPSGSTVAPDYLKDRIKNYLQDYIALPNRVILTDPDYMYCDIVARVQYDKTATKKFPTEIQGIITQAILDYSTDNLEVFDADFRYSRFVADIDNSDTSVTSNDTTVRMVKRLSPLLNFATSFDLDFNNATKTYTTNASVVDSTYFTYVNSDNVSYTLCKIKDVDGTLIVYTYVNNIFTVVNDDLGTIDYTTGIVRINSLKTSSYGSYISLYVIPADKDIIINRDKILIIDPADVSVTVTETTR